MKVVILCGGLGTRLREETEFRPKPMVEIGGKPIIWHIMKIYAHYGFNDFILCLGYKGEMIKEHFYNYELRNNDFTITLGKQKQFKIHSNHDEQNWRITLADTGENTLKGARIKKIEKYLDCDQFMVTYGDGVADINIKELVAFHQSHGKLATVTGVKPAFSRFGKLKIDGEHVTQFSEKPHDEAEFVNGGFFVFNKQLLENLNDSDNCDLEVGLLEKLVSQGELMVFKHTGFWECMDTLRDTEYLNKLWETSQVPWKLWELKLTNV